MIDSLTRSLARSLTRQVFIDPTNRTVGLEKYCDVCASLFDSQCSEVSLLDIRVVSPTAIRARWTLGGVIKLPWRPRVATFEGASTYTLDADGLIAEQREEWSISPLAALLETVTPGAPAGSC